MLFESILGFLKMLFIVYSKGVLTKNVCVHDTYSGQEPMSSYVTFYLSDQTN